MLFLSRLVADPRNGTVRRDLGDCQALHRTVMTAFPQTEEGVSARETFSVLYRVDALPSGLLLILVQSTVLPDWSRLPNGYLRAGLSQDNPSSRRVDEIYRAIPANTQLAFRLRANPTRKVDTKSSVEGQRRNGHRVELGGEAERLDWLTRKARDGGFRVMNVRDVPSVLDVRTVAEARAGGRRSASTSEGRKAGQQLTFGSVLFDGHLIVEDSARFYETIERGIGSAKAYGFGLLSLARAR